jgi:hypothetical protein
VGIVFAIFESAIIRKSGLVCQGYILSDIGIDIFIVKDTMGTGDDKRRDQEGREQNCREENTSFIEEFLEGPQ